MTSSQVSPSLRVTLSSAASTGSEKLSRRSSSNPQRGGGWLSSTTVMQHRHDLSVSVSTRISSRDLVLPSYVRKFV